MDRLSPFCVMYPRSVFLGERVKGLCGRTVHHPSRVTRRLNSAAVLPVLVKGSVENYPTKKSITFKTKQRQKLKSIRDAKGKQLENTPNTYTPVGLRALKSFCHEGNLNREIHSGLLTSTAKV